MMKYRNWLLAGACVLAAAVPALAAGFLTNGLPPAGGTQYPTTVPLTGNETIPVDTNLAQGLNPASESVSANQMAAFIGGLPAKGNVLIGGDASTNLWQRGTTGASVTTTVTYGGPDRWAYWSGASTAMTVSKSTTAGDFPTSYQAAFKMARTASQTGVVPLCMTQEIESVNATQFQGTTAELDFHAYTGANFSAANAQMTAYVTYGTGTDEGTSKLAYGLNAGGGGSTGWTGQANAAAAVVNLGAVSTAGRYAVVANIPATATELAVTLCYTPVGTAGTNDYVAFSGIQLLRNPANAAYASATVGYSAATFPAQSFERRLQGVETLYQQRYYYQLTETAAITPIAPCSAVDTTHTNCLVQFPVPMRTTPTATYAAGFASPTSTTQATLGACSALASATTVTSTVLNPLNVLVNCTATTIPAAGVASFLYSNNGTGTIKVTAEL